MNYKKLWTMTTKILRWGDQQKVFGLVKVRIIEVRIIQVFPWEFVRKFRGDRGISFELVKVRIIRIRIRESWLYVNCNISCSTWWFPTVLIMCQQVKIIGALNFHVLIRAGLFHVHLSTNSSKLHTQLQISAIISVF